MDLVHRLAYNGDGVAFKMGRRRRAKDDFYFDGRGCLPRASGCEFRVASYELNAVLVLTQPVTCNPQLATRNPTGS